MRQRGFTLIEVLVALAIVALGMAAVLEALSSSASAAVHLRQRLFAQWVALNQLEHVRLSGEFPDEGTSTGHARNAARRWDWRQKVIKTQVPGVERIVIDVRPADATDDHNWYATVSGYIGNAIAPPSPLATQWLPAAGGNPNPNGQTSTPTSTTSGTASPTTTPTQQTSSAPP